MMSNRNGFVNEFTKKSKKVSGLSEWSGFLILYDRV